MGNQKTTVLKKGKWKTFKRFLPIYLLALPGLVYLFINNYIPMGGLIIAFKKYSAKKGILGSDWSGFANFKFLFGTKNAWVITRNTLGYNIMFIIIGTIAAITVAILLSEVRSKRASKFYQSVILLPHLVSWVIISYLAFGFLSSQNGFINNSIRVPLGQEAINWYNSPKYWPIILLIVYLWHGIGYQSIVYFAAVIGIDRSYYEAAQVEGANHWQQIRSITLPLLKPTIVTMVILAIGRIFYSDFGLFFQVPMNSGALLSTTNTIDTYVYRGLLEQSNIGMSAAAGFYQSVVGFVVVMAANALVRKFDRENAMF